jgi:DNA-binding HxlR family transcriptional regulator
LCREKSTIVRIVLSAASLDIWGDKWSLLIIRNMMFYDLNTYGEFLNAPEKIATNILADRLQKLEEAGVNNQGRTSGKQSQNIL